MIETILAEALLAAPAIAALVEDRIYPAPLDQLGSGAAQVPAVTYHRISTVAPVCLDGETPMATLRIQFDCWAEPLVGVRALATAVRERLNGYHGPSLKAVFLTSGGGDEYEPDTKLRRVQMDFSITCQEGDA